MCRDRGRRRRGYASPVGLVIWASKPLADGFLVWASKLGWSSDGNGRRRIWHHCEAYVEAKQSHEEPVAVRCTDLKIDHFALWVKWFRLNI